MQIKVKDTRMHKVQLNLKTLGLIALSGDGTKKTPVAESKLVLVGAINTDKVILFEDINGKYHQSIKLDQPWKMWKPILISETEKIEVGDWYLHMGQITQRIRKNPDAEYPLTHYHKILALPEHFSPKHLQAIVDGKLKDGDKVLVECELQGPGFDDSIKLNTSNYITLHKVEEKMYTFENMDELRRRAIDFGASDLSLNKWFEQNVK